MKKDKMSWEQFESYKLGFKEGWNMCIGSLKVQRKFKELKNENNKRTRKGN